jgi:hypothetical protein
MKNYRKLTFALFAATCATIIALCDAMTTEVMGVFVALVGMFNWANAKEHK